MSAFRSKFIFLIIFLYFFVIFGRLFFLQIVKGQDYERKSEAQREGLVEIPASRGLILSNDNYPLADNQISYVLNFDKYLLQGKSASVKKSTLDKLVSYLISDENIFSKIEGDDKTRLLTREKNVEAYVKNIVNDKKIKAGVVYKKLSTKTKENIEKLNIPEFFFTEENLRRYPESSMSAHVLGFLGRDEKDNLKGYFGLEGYYERELKGINGYKIYEKDPLGRPILLELYEKKEPINGRSLLTSIDRSAESILEKWIKWGVEKYEAKSGSAILYDPHSGEIAALAVYPNFDPNNYYLTGDDVKKNLVISDEYEPGSIMKPLIMSAALNEHLITPDTRCPRCTGPREVSGYLIKTFDENYLPNLTMREVLERSDNTGMTYVGELLGKERILSYLKKLGFGSSTKIDLEGEVPGFVKAAKDIYAIDQATMTFGQGISVNSIQMLKAWGALVTGKTMKPHVVTAFLGQEREDKVQPEIDEQVYSKETVKTITNLLVDVAKKSPLHFASDRVPSLKDYQIAAKSGTAQIALGGKYAKNITIGTAIGFAPAYNPKFILLVKLDEAQANIWGANTAGPVFFNIWNDLFLYYNIPPQ